MIINADKLISLPEIPATPNVVPIELTDQPGEDTGWSNFNYLSDWGTTEATWNGSYSNDVQREVTSGSEITLWEKMHSTSEQETISTFAASFDSAITTFKERGYIQASWGIGVSVSVTMDMSNKDIYLGFTTGGGLGLSAGLTPGGIPQSDFLSGWAINQGFIVGGTYSSGYLEPHIGTPSLGIGWSWNATAAFIKEATKVVNEASIFFNRVNAIPGPNDLTNPPEYIADAMNSSIELVGTSNYQSAAIHMA